MEDYNNEQKEEEEVEESQTNSQTLGKNQKIAVGVLAVSAVLVIVLWAAQLKNSINSPFAYNPGNSSQTDSSSSSDAASAEALKTKDTDNDGLTDWDELNTYKTSPYLEDSDSDGFTDKEEINKGTDPNCPEGRTCSSSADTSAGNANTGTATGDSATSDSSSAPSDLGLDLNNATGNSSQTQVDIQKTLSGQSDVSTLRQMLLDSGMDQKTLDAISDEDLMASYNEVLGSQ